MPDTTIARAESSRGEVVLRRRERDGALELRVNGVFVMDDQETSTERALASLALDAATGNGPQNRDRHRALRVLVGGLGLGYTLAAFLESPDVASILVAEI